MTQQRRAKIVATIGPATDTEESLEALLAAGVDVVRLNFSHGTHADHERRLKMVRRIADRLRKPIAIMLDLQGPKIRTGTLVGGQPVTLTRGQPFAITTNEVEGTAQRVSTTYAGLPGDCRTGDTVLVDDGKIKLIVTHSQPSEVTFQVVDGGLLKEHKGINLPGVAVSAPALSEKDEEDLAFGLGQGVDLVAMSFVREASDLHQARAFMAKHGRTVPLISKLEKPQAIDHLDAIIAASDGVMVARGDLGVEMAPEDVPPIQKTIIHKANRRGIPVITATQMLESMIEEAVPTRAEASDVANSIWDGTDAVMLSGESAVGKHPVEAVEMMHRIVVRAEATMPVEPHEDRGRVGQAQAICRAATGLADDLKVAAIAGFTRTGRTGQLLSTERPRVPIYVFTSDEQVYRRLALWWGVSPILEQFSTDSDGMIREIEGSLLARQALMPGDLAVVVGALPFRPGAHTNFVKLHTVGAVRR
ncbi:MAG: pyruvate kinase [Chloroflexota bacterium]